MKHVIFGQKLVLEDRDWVALSNELVLLRRVGLSFPHDRLQAIQDIAEQNSDLASPSLCDLLMSIALIYFYATAEPRRALRPSSLALSIAERLGDPSRLRKALNVHAIVCADTMDAGMAIHCYDRALSIATSLGDLEAQVIVLNNLGSALMISGAYSDAVECFHRAICVAIELESPSAIDFSCNAKANSALCYLYLERPEIGISLIDEAIRTVKVPDMAHELVACALWEGTYTQLLLIAERHLEARVHAKRARDLAETSMSPRAMIAGRNANSLVDVFEGHYEIGIARLKQSLDKTDALQAARRDTLSALVMACERSNRIDLAIEYQEELLASSNLMALDNLSLHAELHHRKLISKRNDDEPQERRIEQLHLGRLLVESKEYDNALSTFETFERIAATVAMREDPSGGHPYRVGRLVSLLAEDAGIDQITCRTLDLAARLHDIGNVAIPDRLMLSPLRLAPHELDLVKSHSVLGAEMLKGSDVAEIALASKIARGHHERWDGKGYPDGLVGESIPLEARMTGIAETYDALTHARPHRPAITSNEALSIVKGQAGFAFDPQLVNLFVDLLQRLQQDRSDLEEFLEGGARSSRYVMSRRSVIAMLHNQN